MDKLSIINRALGMIGETPVTSPEAPNTKAGKHLVSIFDQCRREILRRYPWNFSETWAEIDRTTAPPFYYSDAYALPASYLRLLWVGDIANPIRDYRLLNQGDPDFRRVIAMNNAGATKLKISYSADVTVYPLWDPLAIKAFALWMAMDAAKNVAGQTELVGLLSKQLTEELKDAVSVDAQEQAIREHTWSNVRDARTQAQFGLGFTNVEGYN